jgi:hypothetical protein
MQPVAFKVLRGPEIENHGVWPYRVEGLGLSGQSHQPLLDACRRIKRAVGPTTELAGLFRDGRETPDLICAVHAGADLTVVERGNGTIRFEKYRPWSASRSALPEPGAEVRL